MLSFLHLQNWVIYKLFPYYIILQHFQSIYARNICQILNTSKDSCGMVQGSRVFQKQKGLVLRQIMRASYLASS